MSLTKIYNFDDGADYTFDSDLVEVSGNKAKQKAQVYTDETFFADFSETVNGRRGLGDLVTTNRGNPVIENNRLNLKGEVDKWIKISATGNHPTAQEGCWEFTFIPNYVSAPSGNEFLMSSRKGLVGNSSLIHIRYNPSRLLNIEVRDNASGLIISSSFSFNIALGVKYRISLNYNFNSGAGNGFVRIFVNGIQLGTDIACICTMDEPDRVYIGSAASNDLVVSNNFEIENVQLFSTVQRTANYTPDYDTEDFLTYNNQNPKIFQAETLDAKSLDAYSGSVIEPSGSSVGNVITVDDVDMYFNGLTWVESADYTKVNTITIVNNKKESLDLSVGKRIRPAWYLIGDGWSTPEIDLISMSYSFFNFLEEINGCLISGEFQDQNGNPDLTAIVLVSTAGFYHGAAYISSKLQEYTANALGIIEFILVETVTVNKTMTIEVISDKVKLKKVVTIPNQSQVDLSSLMS